MKIWNRIFLLVLFNICISLHAFDHSSMQNFDYREFYQKFTQQAPGWMIEQINHDLSPFRGQLSKRSLDDFFTTHPELNAFRVKVQRGRLSIETSPTAETMHILPEIVLYIEKLHQLKSLPDVDFIVSTLDVYYPKDQDIAYPVFIVSKNKHDVGLILVPDWSTMAGYFPARKEAYRGSKAHPWKSKTDKIFWRGMSSGIRTNNWLDSPRPQLVALSNQYPQYLDAKFSGVHDTFENTAKELQMLSNPASIRDHLKYKYLIDVDGWSCTWPRTYWILLSNSVLFKQESDNMQWFYSILQPNIHYIPVTKNFSDLFEKLHWAKKNDATCKKIAKNATAFAKEHLSQENSFFYYYKVIEEYAKIQQGCY